MSPDNLTLISFLSFFVSMASLFLARIRKKRINKLEDEASEFSAIKRELELESLDALKTAQALRNDLILVTTEKIKLEELAISLRAKLETTEKISREIRTESGRHAAMIQEPTPHSFSALSPNSFRWQSFMKRALVTDHKQICRICQKSAHIECWNGFFCSKECIKDFFQPTCDGCEERIGSRKNAITRNIWGEDDRLLFCSDKCAEDVA